MNYMAMPISDHTHPKIIEITFSFHEFVPKLQNVSSFHLFISEMQSPSESHDQTGHAHI